MKNKFITPLISLLLMQTALFSSDTEITTIGTILPCSKSSIGSQVTGRVDKVFVEVGTSVLKGQPIVQLDSRPFEITVSQKKAALESARIKLVDAETNFSRMQKLWEKPEGEKPSIPQKKFEDAQSEYAQALVQVKQAEENLKAFDLSHSKNDSQYSPKGMGAEEKMKIC